mmetsp:Transcript_6542/g.19396  ORF Transcript_6542/g.19396 Transcript_6542/m.19396 type:complete len:231 (+) Transcript_6542:289-981(+)
MVSGTSAPMAMMASPRKDGGTPDISPQWLTTAEMTMEKAETQVKATTKVSGYHAALGPSCEHSGQVKAKSVSRGSDASSIHAPARAAREPLAQPPPPSSSSRALPPPRPPPADAPSSSSGIATVHPPSSPPLAPSSAPRAAACRGSVSEPHAPAWVAPVAQSTHVSTAAPADRGGSSAGSSAAAASSPPSAEAAPSPAPWTKDLCWRGARPSTFTRYMERKWPPVMTTTR